MNRIDYNMIDSSIIHTDSTYLISTVLKFLDTKSSLYQITTLKSTEVLLMQELTGLDIENKYMDYKQNRDIVTYDTSHYKFFYFPNLSFEESSYYHIINANTVTYKDHYEPEYSVSFILDQNITNNFNLIELISKLIKIELSKVIYKKSKYRVLNFYNLDILNNSYDLCYSSALNCANFIASFYEAYFENLTKSLEFDIDEYLKIDECSRYTQIFKNILTDIYIDILSNEDAHFKHVKSIYKNLDEIMNF